MAQLYHVAGLVQNKDNNSGYAKEDRGLQEESTVHKEKRQLRNIKSWTNNHPQGGTHW